jgi:hypothetical protein
LNNTTTNQQLFVYEAIVIRYNATANSGAGHSGAGQPLHRDLGMPSVNIMLNDDADFTGWGTILNINRTKQQHNRGYPAMV